MPEHFEGLIAACSRCCEVTWKIEQGIYAPATCTICAQVVPRAEIELAINQGRPLVGHAWNPCPDCGVLIGFDWVWVHQHGWRCRGCKCIYHTIELYPVSLKMKLQQEAVAKEIAKAMEDAEKAKAAQFKGPFKAKAAQFKGPFKMPVYFGAFPSFEPWPSLEFTAPPANPVIQFEEEPAPDPLPEQVTLTAPYKRRIKL